MDEELLVASVDEGHEDLLVVPGCISLQQENAIELGRFLYIFG